MRTNDQSTEVIEESNLVGRSTDQAVALVMPAPVTASDKLRTIYREPGPYTSVYLSLLPGGEEDLHERWTKMRRDLEAQGSSLAALAAIESRLALPGPEDVAGIALISTADGTTIVDYGLEPPRHDLGVVDNLPYVAPILEWQQRRIAHLVVTVDGTGADVAVFGLDHYVRLDSYRVEPETLVEPIASTAELMQAELVVLSGEPEHLGHLADVLPRHVPLNCRVIADSSATDAEQLTEFVVRCLSDIAAEATVHRLQDQRFFAGHDGAVDGTAEVVAALANSTADRVLLHDDPNDQRRLWIGDEANELSIEQHSNWIQARVVDALIRSALLQNIPVHIIPTTGPEGPDENTAALTEE